MGDLGTGSRLSVTGTNGGFSSFSAMGRQVSPDTASPTLPQLDQTGSLLRMFRSEGFDAHMHISYLFKMKDNPGVQDYLTNELYKMKEPDVDFYLPELCLMGLSRVRSDKLHAFLLDKAASRMYYAVKIHWMFQSAVEDTKPPINSELLDNALKLYQESEMAVVNSRSFSEKVIELAIMSNNMSGREDDELDNDSCPSPPPRLPPIRITREDDQVWVADTLSRLRDLSRHVTVKATEKNLFDTSLGIYKELGDAVPSSTAHWRGGALAAAEMFGTFSSAASSPVAGSPTRKRGPNSSVPTLNELDLFMLKQLRCDCFNLQNNFVTQLTRLSNLLVGCPTPQERKRILYLSMAQLNHWLLDRRIAMAISGGETYLTGVSLPIPSPTSEFTHIVKVHIDDCKVFRTRQRAPYLITIELVDFSDMLGPHCGEKLAKCILRELSWDGDLDEEDDNSLSFLKKLGNSLNRPLGPDEVRRCIYPDKLSEDIITRRASVEKVKAGPVLVVGTPATSVVCDGEVIVVDDSAVTVLPGEVGGASSPVSVASSKSSKKTNAIEFRKKVWGELNEDRIEAIRLNSVYGHLPSWRVQRVIVKGGDDVRQEVMAGQLVAMFKNIFQQARLPLWLRPYEVVVTSANSGLIEMVPNTVSIDSLKKEFGGTKNLNEIFTSLFSDHLEEAQYNFISSCAAYSVVSYFLSVRDRHNGNLLLDSDGHLIHIDFGFMLSNAPGGTFALETCPFKLTQEFVDVMGGEYSTNFEHFRTFVIRAFLEARKYRDQICQLVRIVGECNPKLACFLGSSVESVVQTLSDRFFVNFTEQACIEKVVGLIDESLNNWRTIQYDNYQRITNGIL